MVKSTVTTNHPAPGRPIELSIDKAGRTLAYRCDPGHEAELIQRLAHDAADPDTPLTWFDAAVLCHRVGLSMRDVLNQHRPENPPSSVRDRAAGNL
ncbi:MAG: hypothetical protein AAGK09_14025 [Planctomycetota bacterium]